MNNEHKTNINWYPGHMAKTKREIKEKLDLIDIVYEIIDSRMPKSSRIKDLDELIGKKPRILIFTKYDMCDKEITDKFIHEYGIMNSVIKVNLKENNTVTKEIVDKTEQLLGQINSKRIEKGLAKRSYRVLVVGVPNVGKSTLINRLAGRNIAKTANMAGVTKNLSWIRLNKNLELLDSPGILWPKIEETETSYNLASLTSIKEEILDKEMIAYYIVEKLLKLYPHLLKEKYQLDDLNMEIVDIINAIGRKRGCLLKGNVIDLEKTYSIIINDVKDGKIGNITFDR